MLLFALHVSLHIDRTNDPPIISRSNWVSEVHDLL